MNTYYRKNLKDLAQASKDYTNKRASEILEMFGYSDFDKIQYDSTSAYTKSLPNGISTVKLKKLGGNCIKYAPSVASDETIAKDKVLPENTYTVGLNYIGGMSYKSENKIVLQDVPETTLNGITYKIEDGVITINGTATSTTAILISLNDTISSGSYYTKFYGISNVTSLFNYIYFRNNGTYVDYIPRDNGERATTLNTNVNQLDFNLINGATFNNFVIKPMLVSGSTAPTEFKQGFEDIRDSAVTSVKSYGSNLWDEVFELGSIDISNGQNITASSTCRCKNYQSVMPNTTYTLNYVYRVFYYDSSYNYLGYSGLADITGIGKQFTTPYNCAYVRFNFVSEYGTTYLNNIRLNLGSTLQPYKPYVAPITKTIPAEIQALAGYGWGIDDTCYNYIDFESKKFIQKVARVQIKDIAEILYNSNVKVFYFYIANKKQLKISPMLIAGFTFNPLGYQSLNDLEVAENDYTTSVNLKDLSCEDITAFKTKYDNYYLYYELETPVETDISQYLLDSFDKIETNDNYGSIEFVNEYNQDMPNKITFNGIIKETALTDIKLDGMVARTIPSEIQALTGYGWGINDTVYNYIYYDDERKRWYYKQMVGKTTNTTNFSYIDSYTKNNIVYSHFRMYLSENLPKSATNNILPSYNFELIGGPFNNNNPSWIGSANESISWTFQLAIEESIVGNTTATIQSYFTNNPLIVYYELAEPIETDITEYMTFAFNLINATGNETMTFENINKQPVNLSLVYYIDEEE